jgi:hypothetical protein
MPMSRPERCCMTKLSVLLLAVGFSVFAATQNTLAQGLDLKSVYGDEKGCRIAKGEPVEGDDYLVLESDGITSYASACEFVQVLSSKDGTKVATTLCDNEGEAEHSIAMFSIGKSASDPAAFRIYDETGGLWGEVKPCP